MGCSAAWHRLPAPHAARLLWVRTVHRDQREAMQAVVTELAEARQALRRETFADQRDNAKIEALAAKVGRLEQQALTLRLKADQAVADVLTPAQREQFRTAAGPTGHGRGRGGR
jgi:Spy/CpxP family protein refolding chaperone